MFFLYNRRMESTRNLKNKFKRLKFDKSKVYTALNAEDLPIGSLCVFADTMQDLQQTVESRYVYERIKTLTKLYKYDRFQRFIADGGGYLCAYLIEPAAKAKYAPFENVEKAMKAIKEHGDRVKNSLGICWLITGYATKEDVTKCLHIANNWESLDSFLRNYVFADDGSPCGIKINNSDKNTLS